LVASFGSGFQGLLMLSLVLIFDEK